MITCSFSQIRGHLHLTLGAVNVSSRLFRRYVSHHLPSVYQAALLTKAKENMAVLAAHIRSTGGVPKVKASTEAVSSEPPAWVRGFPKATATDEVCYVRS